MHNREVVLQYVLVYTVALLELRKPYNCEGAWEKGPVWLECENYVFEGEKPQKL